MTKKVFCLIVAIMIIAIPLLAQEIPGQYKKVKVILKSNVTATGKNGTINTAMGYLSFTSRGQKITYPMEDIQTIMAKKGNAGTWALAFGGGCAAICAVAVAVGSDEYSTGTLIGGSVIWVGIFSAGGYLIGSLTDKWETVYFAQDRASLLSHFRLKMGINRNGAITVGLSFNF